MVHIRVAEASDVDAICDFGAVNIPLYYVPLIGLQAAKTHLAAWWNEAHISESVHNQEVFVATVNDKVIGVGQYHLRGDEYIIWKLYVHPDYQGNGIGVQLIDAIIEFLNGATSKILIVHFAANERAGKFYERERFYLKSIEPNSAGDHRADTVWREREISPYQLKR